MINIVIVGTKTKNGMRLLKNAERAIQAIKTKINLKTIYEHEHNNYGIKNVPALLIDGKIISQGQVLSEREIHKLLATCA